MSKSSPVASAVLLTSEFVDRFSSQASRSAQDGANAIISYAVSLERLGGVTMTEAFELACSVLGCPADKVPSYESSHPQKLKETTEALAGRLNYNRQITTNAVFVAKRILG